MTSSPSAVLSSVAASAEEDRMRYKIFSIIAEELGLVRAFRLNDRHEGICPELMVAIERAEARGVVSEEEVDDLWVSDILIRAQRASGRQQVHAVVEVSFTINNCDVDRAYQRGRVLSAVTESEAVAAVISGVAEPQRRRRAQERGIRVVIPSMYKTKSPGDHHG